MSYVLGRYSKPSKEDVLLWVKDAMQRIEVEGDVFERTILRSPDRLTKTSTQGEEEEEKEEDNGDYNLMKFEDYDFSDVE